MATGGEARRRSGGCVRCRRCVAGAGRGVLPRRHRQSPGGVRSGGHGVLRLHRRRRPLDGPLPALLAKRVRGLQLQCVGQQVRPPGRRKERRGRCVQRVELGGVPGRRGPASPRSSSPRSRATTCRRRSTATSSSFATASGRTTTRPTPSATPRSRSTCRRARSSARTPRSTPPSGPSSPRPPAPPSAYDFQTIMTHEAGHFLGLAHTGDATAVMYAKYHAGTALQPDDVAAILFGVPPRRDP